MGRGTHHVVLLWSSRREYTTGKASKYYQALRGYRTPLMSPTFIRVKEIW